MCSIIYFITSIVSEYKSILRYAVERMKVGFTVGGLRENEIEGKVKTVIFAVLIPRDKNSESIMSTTFTPSPSPCVLSRNFTVKVSRSRVGAQVGRVEIFVCFSLTSRSCYDRSFTGRSCFLDRFRGIFEPTLLQALSR